jgi:hypothetical protein
MKHDLLNYSPANAQTVLKRGVVAAVCFLISDGKSERPSQLRVQVWSITREQISGVAGAQKGDLNEQDILRGDQLTAKNLNALGRGDTVASITTSRDGLHITTVRTRRMFISVLSPDSRLAAANVCAHLARWFDELSKFDVKSLLSQAEEKQQIGS